ncbi:MAG TPA: hypothetical protein VHP37_05510 [Burkholderiales bacterium]|nr:hypothetical protein [Burkholderiales bacterium]
MKRPALLLGFIALLAHGAAAAVPVDFVNASRATRCAEEDNVYVKIAGSGIASFRIDAVHPPYIATVSEDSTAPDFAHCDMSNDPRYTFAPRTVVLYEDARIRLVGHTFESFWRPDVVDFRVGSRNERGLHLVQLLKRSPQRDIEILVVYPADGYWRAKPLPPVALPDSAYGSSFLFGPIEESTRPYVAIRSIAFEPATLSFRIAFANRTRGVLTVDDATRERVRLALALDPAAPADKPFAALRSMYVAPEQADVAVAAWPDGRSQPILEFTRATAPGARFGRVARSLHNLSAPDLVFEEFATASPR